MIWVLLAVLLAWLGFGPWVVAIALGLLLVPRVRWWMQDHLHLGRRTGTIAVATLALTAALVVVVPDGWLRVPPGAGLLAVPSYVGRPAMPKPVAATAVPQNPHLARSGLASGDGDSWATHASPYAGPLGYQPQIETGWFGLEHCPELTLDSRDRIVSICRSLSGPRLNVVDPEDLRKLASMDLPDVQSGPDVETRCSGTDFFLDATDRVVLATTERSVQAVRTANGEGDPDLSIDKTWDLKPYVPAGDCLVTLRPDWSGRIWWASLRGLVGTIDPTSGAIAVLDLGADIVNSLAIDQSGTYVVTDEALHKLSAGPDGAPAPVWRAAYDRGEERKPGQLSQGSGTTAVVLDDNVVAIADNADPAMHVVFFDAGSGEEVCRRAVFSDGASATESDLVSVGSGVIVTNTYGHSGLRSTALGRAGESGIARVDVAGGECTTRWTSDQVAPASDLRVSWANGLVYAWTKRPTWTGVSAWYATAIDVESGRAMWSVRVGTGALFASRGSSLTIAPDGSLWGSTVAGLVRVRDRASS